jgi:glycosyltransferase involved in cell wall biosynthesis
MRVAVVTWSSRRVGGIEEYLSILIPALHAMPGIDVALWHEMDEPVNRRRMEVPEGVLAISVAEKGVDAALAALRAWRPDVLYTQGLMDLDAEEKLLALAPSVFFIHTYAGTCISGGKTFTRPTVVPCDRTFGWPCLAHYFPHGCGGRSPITMWQQFQRQNQQLGILRRYNAIVTHTDHMRKEMAKHGLHANVVSYPVVAQTVGAAHLIDGTWRLLFAGRMDALKGGLYLIDAMPEVVAAAHRRVRVVLAGDGPGRARWEARAREVQAATPNLTFEFTGWVAQEQVGTLMTNADLLVVPSLWPEPFGSVGPCAGHHGVPAAAFAVGGIPQWLIDDVSGHLAPADPPTPSKLARAIVRCLEDPLHYTALSNGARQVSSRFTMAHHLPELIAVLERVSARPVPEAV